MNTENLIADLRVFLELDGLSKEDLARESLQEACVERLYKAKAFESLAAARMFVRAFVSDMSGGLAMGATREWVEEVRSCAEKLQELEMARHRARGIESRYKTLLARIKPADTDLREAREALKALQEDKEGMVQWFRDYWLVRKGSGRTMASVLWDAGARMASIENGIRFAETELLPALEIAAVKATTDYNEFVREHGVPTPPPSVEIPAPTVVPSEHGSAVLPGSLSGKRPN